MPKLKHYQIDFLKEAFCSDPGYVLDFSNKTFQEFFEDHFETNIYADAFSSRGTSKFNRLLAFIEAAPPHVAIELTKLLWNRKTFERDSHIDDQTARLQSDAWSIDPEYVSVLNEAAASEDVAVEKFLSELSKLPSHDLLPQLRTISADWTLDTVERESTRALDNLERDPEAAITAACSILESIFKSILDARNLDRPKVMDIQSLYKATREPLGLSPSKEVSQTEIEADVRTILSGVTNAIQGIGALRTHAGTAHGRERGFRRVDGRIAKLAVSTSFSLALFIIETWEKRYPEDRLKNSDKE